MDWGDAVPTHTTHAETQMYTRPWFGNVVKSLTLHTARCTRGTPLKTTPPLSGGGDYSFRGCEGLWMETDTASVSPFLRVFPPFCECSGCASQCTRWTRQAGFSLDPCAKCAHKAHLPGLHSLKSKQVIAMG